MTTERSWLIGTSPDCDIVVAQPNVSRQHCRLTQRGSEFSLEDLGSTNGTHVNGTTIRESVRVTPQDVILLGSNARFPWPHVEDQVAREAGRTSVTGGDSPSRVLRIGREVDNDIVLPYPMVSAHHARVIDRAGQLVVEDLGSTNGTAVNSPANRVTQAVITPQDSLFFGSLRVPAARLLEPHGNVGTQSRGSLTFSGREMIFGRDPTCDQVLDYPMISSRHARLYRSGSQIFVEDLGSSNGTLVNGRRITQPVAVQPGDVIGLGSYTFTFAQDGRIETRDCRGNVSIEAREIAVEVPGRRLLERVSLTIMPGEFVGLMGPSGAGKTTLMNALNGYSPPASGHVLFNGSDLYANYTQFAQLLGYVPQDDIIHRDLTVGQALYYTARLRLPPDTTGAEIRERIRRVLHQLSLESTEHVLIGSPEKKGISGGQRKRVNLAMELLTDPSVLFLDEPTSGLSSEDALLVMKLLRSLADSGKSILLTIHQPSLEAYRLMDNLVLVGKDQNSPDPGVLVYYGPAYPDAVHFFNPQGVPGLRPGMDPSPDEVLRGLAKQPTRHWTGQYGQSRYQREYVTQRAGQSAMSSAVTPADPARRMPGFSQWLTLVGRCFTIKRKDTWNTIILLAQAPIVALLVVFVFGSEVSQKVIDFKSWTDSASSTSVTMFLLGLSALWFGCSNSAREIVGEWAIYHRERMVNLKLPSYVASKIAVLGTLCVVQCLTLIAIVHWGVGLKGNWVALLTLLLLVSSVGIALGLTLSAVARTSEVAIALLPIVLLPMVILGGVMQPVHKMNHFMRGASTAAPSRWVFESMLLVEARARPTAPPSPLTLPEGAPLAAAEGKRNSQTTAAISEPDIAEHYFPSDRRSAIATGLIVLVGMWVFLVGLVHLVLRARDVH
jgi:ABC-type multidrug transport system ATPase subunit/ABC-type multidrug transport system permease subunit